MAVTLPPSLAEFGTRSLITHAIMAVTFTGAIAFITAITGFLIAAGQFYDETSVDRAQ